MTRLVASLTPGMVSGDVGKNEKREDRLKLLSGELKKHVHHVIDAQITKTN